MAKSTPPSRAADLEGHEAYQARRTFANLDGVRAVSIAGVLMHHFLPGMNGLPMLSRGFLGVDMFFVLSGFLIVTLLLRERDRTGGVSLKKFYARRSLRIFPLYYLVILIVTGMVALFDRGAFSWEAHGPALPYLLTYTINWTTVDARALDVTWSLATEEQFYLVWPFIIATFSERGARVAAVGGLALNVVAAFALIGYSPRPIIMDMTYAPILFGVVLAHVLHDLAGFTRARRLLGQRGASLAWGALILILVNLPNGDITGLHRTVIHLAMTAWLTSLLVREDGLGHGLFRLPVVRRAGAISYGLYLWHMLALTVALRVAPEGPVSALVATIVTVVVAELSFRFFEQPFLRLKKRFEVRARAVQS